MLLRTSLRSLRPATRAKSFNTSLRPAKAGQTHSAHKPLRTHYATIVRSMPPDGSTGVSMTSPQTFLGFDLVKSFKLDYTDVHVSKWRSRITGLSIVHLDYDAPLVNGYFVVATEIFDDSGCPHTLEHLVFMGSEQYPYKGIIDHLANRGFSNGTNAWTDTDHTAYTVSTAGEQGFMQLLPIYVDHILYPTMTKAGFVTEVHHIDPKGHDSGVVYSEMQGRENTSGDLMQLRHQRLVNPTGSAYRSETGGLMKALRVLTVEEIKAYHAKYYVPHNLTLVVCGKLASGTTSLLSMISDKVEPVLIKHGQNKGPQPPHWKRPFMETESANRLPIAKTVKETVEFPEKDESVGEVVISFSGPHPMEFLERKALDVIGTYLTSSPVAPLNKEYVETDSPLCTYIYFGEDTRATLVDLPVYIGSVPTEHIDSFDERLKASLTAIADKGLDMKRMAMVIDRDERQLRSKLESAKGDVFSGTVISDALYGPADGGKLSDSMDEINQYATLRKWTNEEWVDLLRKYYIDPPRVIVTGKPSASLARSLEKDEKARLAKQIKELGPEGIAKAAKELEEAKAEHDQAIPEEILTSFPVPDVSSIAWIPVSSVQEPGRGRALQNVGETPAEELRRHIEHDGEDLPFFVQFDHVKSDFVTIHALFSLADLPNDLRPYISTMQVALFSLPVRRTSGELLDHEEVVNQLDDETVSYEATLGFSGLFNEILRFSIKVETSRYESAVAWLRDIVYGSQFDKERLQVSVAKIQQNLPELKRDGNTVLGAVSAQQLYDANSTQRAGSVVEQMDFIPIISKQLQDSPDDVIAKLETIRKYITNPKGARFSVAGNILAVEKPRSTWGKHFGDKLEAISLDPVPLASQTLSELGKNPAKDAVVVSLPTIESAYVSHTSKGIMGFKHPDHPALRVAIEVLNATESYLWRYIRGSGLAYGAYVSSDTETGLLTFSLYRTSNSMEAFRQAASVVNGLVDGLIAFDDTTLDAAKSSIVFNISKSVSTASRAAGISFINQALKGVSQNQHVHKLEELQAVTKDDVLKSLRKYFLPLFDPATSVAAVVTSPGKANEVVEGLKELGFEVKQRVLAVDPAEMDVDESESGSDTGSEGGTGNWWSEATPM